jgi:hypothetical protein
MRVLHEGNEKATQRMSTLTLNIKSLIFKVSQLGLPLVSPQKNATLAMLFYALTPPSSPFINHNNITTLQEQSLTGK